MTNEQIEAARGRLVWELKRGLLTESVTQCLVDVAALCAAAQQPDSLVGRKVRFRTSTIEPPVVRAVGYILEFADGFKGCYERDDFEPLEDS